MKAKKCFPTVCFPPPTPSLGMHKISWVIGQEWDQRSCGKWAKTRATDKHGNNSDATIHRAGKGAQSYRGQRMNSDSRAKSSAQKTRQLVWADFWEEEESTLFKYYYFKSLLNLLQYHFCCLCSGFIFTMRHVGSQLPDQGSKPHSLHWKAKS